MAVHSGAMAGAADAADMALDWSPDQPVPMSQGPQEPDGEPQAGAAQEQAPPPTGPPRSVP